MQRIIVTGGLGFIGSNLVHLLIKKKYHPIIIDKFSYASNLYNLKGLKKNNYTVHKFSIENKKKILNLLNKYKPKAIFNLAAETHVDRSIESPDMFIKSNILGVFNILECIKEYVKKNKIKMVHVSTDEVYGDIKKNKKSLENDRYFPSSPYSASKASADHLITSYVRTFNLPIVISNCCNNFGPRQFPEKLIPKTIFNLVNNKDIPIYGKGINEREWIYVDDHCEGLIKILKKGKIGQSYNIGSGNVVKNLDLIKKIIKVYKNNFSKNKHISKIKFVLDRPGHDLRYALNSNKIKRKLKWKPKNKLDMGIKKTIDWYIKNPNFYNKKQQKKFDKRIGLI